MKKIMAVLIICVLVLSTSGCTQQDMTKNFGGSMTIELDNGVKLEEITWKEDNLWYLTRPMREDEEPETHQFSESSSWGIWEGTITIVESK